MSTTCCLQHMVSLLPQETGSDAHGLGMPTPLCPDLSGRSTSQLTCVSLSQHFEPVCRAPVSQGNKHQHSSRVSLSLHLNSTNSLVLLEFLHQPNLYLSLTQFLEMCIYNIHVTAYLRYLPVATRGRP